MLGAIAPISLMAWLSWHTAMASEKEHLQALADNVLDRTNLAIFEAAEALKSLTPLHIESCSRDHIALMPLMIVNTPALQEIGYFNNRMRKCTSWGPVEQAIPRDVPDFSMWDGVGITTMMLPLISGAIRC
ncbi:MAG: hypothetical protein GAK35_01421 [Herbaspirillum frisingense]|uniref:Putative cyclic diguanylate phosphodiesterase CSS motif-containing domain-containing protein n=1 Tax=Herbaspirillum frisingense TaxID=92645 RepID=A0A7V8FY45_9BURK|nr:MAG: hypothetical protein GAK35_01421 [Herbaspirillum frisingense]